MHSKLFSAQFSVHRRGTDVDRLNPFKIHITKQSEWENKHEDEDDFKKIFFLFVWSVANEMKIHNVLAQIYLTGKKKEKGHEWQLLWNEWTIYHLNQKT